MYCSFRFKVHSVNATYDRAYSSYRHSLPYYLQLQYDTHEILSSGNSVLPTTEKTQAGKQIFLGPN